MILLDDIDDVRWARAAATHGSVFHAPGWQRVLAAAFRVRAFCFLDEDGGDGCVLHVFSKGPFRVGYVGFPVGGTFSGEALGPLRLSGMEAARIPARPHLLRLVASGFRAPESVDAMPSLLPETAIESLDGYDAERIARVRHDLRRAKRAGVVVTSNTDASLALTLHANYAETVAAHGGTLKYGPGYFLELLRFAQREPRVRALIAQVDQRYAGFLILVFEGRIAYYLHGAVAAPFRSCGVSDALVDAAIRLAMEQGMRSFNLMASPSAQPTLVKFKEKWGAVTRDQEISDLAWSPAMARCIAWAQSTQRAISRWRGGASSG